jgi:2-methylcitrate dehydratase PrpD
VDALGLAFSLPPYPLLPAFLSSDAKTLSASVPVRLGLDACDAAAAGLRGHAGILEDPDGFLARFATVPLPEAVDLDLGVRWHTDSLSFKVHPGGPGLDAAVDCASELVSRLGVLDAGDIASVVVETSLYTIVVEQKAGAFVDGPASPVHALVFHTPYAVATTLLTGAFTPADLAPPLLDDGARWDLAARVRIEHDEAMTRESLLCEVPFGEAVRQAGPRAATWLSEVGGDWLVDLVGTPPPPSPTFDGVAKRTPARVVLTLTDGSVHAAERSIPVGATGDPSRDDHGALVREKWLSVGGDQKVADVALSLRTASSSDVRLMLDAAL